MSEIYKLPLPIDKLQEILAKDENSRFISINYKESAPLKTIGFLSYTSNLNLVVDLKLDGCTEDDIAELLKTYMVSNKVSQIEILNLLTCKCILEFIGVDTTDIIVFDFLDSGFCDRFNTSNKELLLNYFVFISSLVGYGELVLYRNNFIDVEPTFNGVVDDVKWVGSNVVNLFKIPSFFEVFFSVEGIVYPKILHTIQFNDFCFNGHDLFYYFYDAVGGYNWILNTLIESLKGVPDDNIDPSSTVS